MLNNLIYKTVLNGNLICSKDQPYNKDSDATSDIEIITESDPLINAVKVRAIFSNNTQNIVRLSQLDIGIETESVEGNIHYFTSGWGTEFSPLNKIITPKSCEVFSFGSKSGRSGNGFVPWAGVEDGSSFYAIALGWSGSWSCTCAGTNNRLTVTMGISSEDFFSDVMPGGIFQSPFVYIAKGSSMDSACLELRRYFRKHIGVLDKLGLPFLPTGYNTWWPFEDKEINEDVFQKNAELAQKVGCSYAIMDAGWFGDEDQGENWFNKRGDWDVVNTKHFPSGMKSLCTKAHEAGILPGIWCEIEAVGSEAKLLDTHPHLIAKRDGISLGYVCFGNKETRAWASDVLGRIISEYGARWIKLDFNLDPAPGCNEKGHGHGDGDGLYAHYIGYYEFLDELRKKYPHVVFENCASGGQRMDIELLSHTHLTYLSDPDHTELHLRCFWGALSYLHQSACYHSSWSETMGQHNLGLRTPIGEDMTQQEFDFIFRAAMMGIPCYFYDLTKFPQWCLDRLAQLNQFYKEISKDFILNGDAFRLTPQPLTDGGGERYPAFQFNSQKGEALIFCFRLQNAPAQQTVYLQMLEQQTMYQVAYTDSELCYDSTGADLCANGIRFTDLLYNTSEIVRITPRDIRN